MRQNLPPLTRCSIRPDLSERLREADDATKRTRSTPFELRVVYDNDGDRLSIGAR